MFTGGALLNGALFALGIMPYISASIIMQLMGAVFPHLARLQQEVHHRHLLVPHPLVLSHLSHLPHLNLSESNLRN